MSSGASAESAQMFVCVWVDHFTSAPFIIHVFKHAISYALFLEVLPVSLELHTLNPQMECVATSSSGKDLLLNVVYTGRFVFTFLCNWVKYIQLVNDC